MKAFLLTPLMTASIFCSMSSSSTHGRISLLPLFAIAFDVVRLYENGDCAPSMTSLYQPNWFWIHRTIPTPLQTTLSSVAQTRKNDFKTPLEVLKESIKPVGKAELTSTALTHQTCSSLKLKCNLTT